MKNENENENSKTFSNVESKNLIRGYDGSEPKWNFEKIPQVSKKIFFGKTFQILKRSFPIQKGTIARMRCKTNECLVDRLKVGTKKF